jgi:hypothetical protein
MANSSLAPWHPLLPRLPCDADRTPSAPSGRLAMTSGKGGRGGCGTAPPPHRPWTTRLHFDINVDFTNFYPIFTTHLIASSTRPPLSVHRQLHQSARLWRFFPSTSHLPRPRSDQPTCVIHLGPVTSIVVLHTSSPSSEGCSCFRQQWCHQWSPLLLRPYRRRLCPRPSSKTISVRPCAHGLHQVVWVLCRLLWAPSSCHSDPWAFCQIVWVYLLASSSTTSSPTSSTPATTGYILHSRLPWWPSLLVP